MEDNFCLSLLFSLVHENFTIDYGSWFLIIGIIGPVTNIGSVIDNCTNISIYWDSPTLDDDRVSILYYNLSIYDDITGSLMNTVIVNGTSYWFEDKNLFRNRYTYVITGVNKLGEGISNNKTSFYQRGMLFHCHNLIVILLCSSKVSSREC